MKEILVKGGTAEAFEVRKGGKFKLTDVEGGQVADAHRRAVFDRLEVTHAELDGEASTIPALLAMLHGRAHVGR